MNKPIEFIKIDNAGKCTLTEEAEEMLSKIDSNLAVICIAGIYRSGKSYLLNRLLGRQDGFEIGPTISSCTKGLWIWGDTVKLNNKNTEVLVIDTEGLASAFEDRNESIDMVIFCLALLLSSLFIYNSMKNIDESAIENLALVLNFAKKIQSKYNEINDYANNFPSFLWVLRDFALELIDNQGNEVTTKQYLENALREENINMISNNSYNKGILEEINKKNDIRKIFKNYFIKNHYGSLLL
jgi:GTPase SAR1 family protein